MQHLSLILGFDTFCVLFSSVMSIVTFQMLRAKQNIIYKHIPHVVQDSSHRICNGCQKVVANYKEDGEKVICANCQVGGK